MPESHPQPDPHDTTRLREEVEDEVEDLAEDAAKEEQERMDAREAAGVDEPSD